MEVRIIKVGNELPDILKHCWNVETHMSKKKLFASNDSILEAVEYYIYARAPRSVALQMETHKKKYGCYVWLQSSRPDLATAIKNVPYTREAEINFVIKCNARALKEIAHQRCCKKAEEPTRAFMDMLITQLMFTELDLVPEMVPLCVFRGGICTEFNSCKKDKKHE